MNNQGVSNTDSARGGRLNTLAATAWLKSELYFGMHRSDGSVIPEAAWTRYLNQAVAPRFPGYTVTMTQGSYLNRKGDRVTEPSRVLTLVHPDEFGARAYVAALKCAWELGQAQESVLVVTSRVEVQS